MKSIFIFRRDFRISDNTALNQCIEDNDDIYPIFIFTPEQIKNNSYKSNNAVQFMIESLKHLSKKIDLSFMYGDYINVLNDLIKKNNIDAVYTNTDYTKYAIKREKDIEKLCKKLNVTFKYFDDICLFKPGTLLTTTNKIYQKFTPFYNLCLTQKVNEPKTLKNIKEKSKIIKSKYLINKSEIDKYYKHNPQLNIKGGRKEALKILKSIDKFKSYDKTRNTLAIETTHLSGYLKFGCLSIREVYHKFKKKLGMKDPLIRQLIWRDFYYHLGNGFIERFGKSLKPKYDGIKWSTNSNHLQKWKDGNTGYPIVDACMKEMNTTGYMHNRGRLIVASFLIKNLQINWESGEKYFAQTLLDYDVLVNNGNWQWVSGSGADSQPYFRIFNPWTQSEKFDKECEYIKYWLPNLKDVPNKHLHQWEKFYTEYDLKDLDYYKPMVDYKESRVKALDMYKKGLY
uniref:Photolyase/cryptochrome alpha/beta domain-containing protein n=1 Tax=viral metagenome TaxID=1070528 RepID=A0A6C0J610_9ZZZZ